MFGQWLTRIIVIIITTTIITTSLKHSENDYGMNTSLNVVAVSILSNSFVTWYLTGLGHSNLDFCMLLIIYSSYGYNSSLNSSQMILNNYSAFDILL